MNFKNCSYTKNNAGYKNKSDMIVILGKFETT